MLKFKVHFDGLNAMLEALADGASKAERTVAIQAEKDTRPFVPADTLSLANRTTVRGNLIIYPGPYARYLYHGKVMVDEHGNGPRHYIDKNGNEVIRFPFGSKLHATDRDLKFDKTTHKLAQAHWFDASKARNLEKWLKIAGEEITDELT